MKIDMMNLSEIAEALSLPPEEAIDITGVSIDSRQIAPGELFVAVAGERFDGHDFIEAAVAAGASAVLCSKAVSSLSVPQLIVPDTIIALGKIAKAYKAGLACPGIALTGSNGKTTVKEMIASILPQPSYATQGNFNNHLGVPLSVLQLEPSHRYAVFELGANHPGEIAYTMGIVQADVALINNIGPAHLAGFGSIEGVARAKGEIYAGLKVGALAIVNDDDDYAHFWDDLLIDKTVLRFSSERASDFYLSQLSFDADDKASFLLHCPDSQHILIHLQVPGRHNVQNALAAAACCFALGIDLEQIQQGLNHYCGVKGRLTFLAGRNHSLIIDDSYNANLASTKTALQVLAKRKGQRTFVFGDMAELGDEAILQHQAVGDFARELGIDRFYSCGEYSRYAFDAFAGEGGHFSDKSVLADELQKELNAGSTVLLKGSRSSAMEEVVNALVADGNNG